MNNTSSQPRVVIGIVQDENGRFLVIERAGDSDGSLRYAFPGGKVEIGESDEAAVLREVFEETGIHATVLCKLGKRVHPDTQRTIAYFQCTAAGQTPVAAKLEAKTARFYSGAEALALFTTDIYPPVRRLLQSAPKKPNRTFSP